MAKIPLLQSDMRAACSDLEPKTPTDLLFGDGASIEQALDAFEQALLSLASGVCTKRMALERMKKMTSAPEPTIFMGDEKEEDDDDCLAQEMELDEPKFDSMEACYKVLFELIDSRTCPPLCKTLSPCVARTCQHLLPASCLLTLDPPPRTSLDVLIKMLDELPPGEANVDVPATSSDDAEAIGRMSRPAHILGELDGQFLPSLCSPGIPLPSQVLSFHDCECPASALLPVHAPAKGAPLSLTCPCGYGSIESTPSPACRGARRHPPPPSPLRDLAGSSHAL